MDINHSFLPHSDSIDFVAGVGNDHVHGGGTVNLPSGDIHNITGGVLTSFGDLIISQDFQNDSTGLKFCGNDGSVGVNIPHHDDHPPSVWATFHADF